MLTTTRIRITMLVFCLALILATTHLRGVESKPALQVSLDHDVVRAQFIWLDYGQVVNNTTKSVTLRVRNVSNRAIVTDAFSWSSTLRTQWLNPQSESEFKNRTILNPGEEKALIVEARFSDSDPSPKMISLMTSGSEILQIVGKELIQPQPRVTKIATNTGAFWFSGDGDAWSGWYELHLHAAPPGYALDPSTVRVDVQDIGVEGHLRRCGAWAVCEIVQQDGSDVSARMSVQGHHEGGLMNTNVHLRFTAQLQAEYALKESLRLAAVDYNILPSPTAKIQNSPGSPSKALMASGGSISIIELAGSSPRRTDPFLAPAPLVKSLADVKPDLNRSCANALSTRKGLTSCIELAHWVAAQSDRPNHNAEAIDLYTKACHAGSSRGCTELGLLGGFTDGAKTADDELRHACDLGDGLACYQLGQKIEGANSTGANHDLRAQLYAKACQLHFPAPGCERKALAPRKEHLVTAQPQR